MKVNFLATLTTALLLGGAQGRVWTNVDGSKTFEADFISTDGKTVTVKRGVRQMTFKIDLLSKKDQEWAKEAEKKRVQAEANKVAAEKFENSDFGKAVSKLCKFDGTKFSDHALESPPKFFLLYFSASW